MIIYAEGEHVIPSRAVHLFGEGFFRSLAAGRPSGEAFRKGVDKVRHDDRVGEVACPDREPDENTAPDDNSKCVPSPFKRLRINEAQAVSFPVIAPGKVEVRDLLPPAPPHRRIVRSDELMMGREVAIARLMDELLPPESGLRENKRRLINLYGEGGIGKTRLAQSVCDAMEDYRHFPGGIYEVECEGIPDARQLAISILKALGGEGAEKIADPVTGLLELLGKTTASAGDILLMLDNIDPLFSGDQTEETARLLKQTLSACPDLRILSTCRTKLDLGGYAFEFSVDPLDFEVALLLFLVSITDSDVRAQIQSLPPELGEHLIRLVKALEGHPLSIFLAAHWIVAGPDPIVEQLRQAERNIMKILDAPEMNGAHPRQRSLGTTLDLSYNRLSGRGREIFRKGSLFPGGLHRRMDTLDALLGEGWREAVQEAADIGLIRYEREAQRYWMLNPLREYGEALLGKEGDEFRRQVADHWAQFATLQNLLLNPAQDQRCLAEVNLLPEPDKQQERLAQLHKAACYAFQSEEANILFAFRWSLRNRMEAAEHIASGMMDYLKMYDKRQRNAWMAQATLEACRTPELRGKWLNNLGIRLADLGDREGALNCFGERRDVGRCLRDLTGDDGPFVRACVRLADFLVEIGRGGEALPTSDEAATVLLPLAEKITLRCGT